MIDSDQLRWPDFLVIGAQKCGTTALYHALAQHPQIFMSPVKEPRYFAFADRAPSFCGPGADEFSREVIRNPQEYKSLFQGAPAGSLLGEATPLYLSAYRPAQTAQAIHRHVPSARLIAVLRHPAKRAYSAFLHTRGLGWELETDFRRALDAEPGRMQSGWLPAFYYRHNGNYAANLQPFFFRFPRGQIRVYLYDDWNDRPLAVVQDIFRFLSVDDAFTPVLSGRFNESRIPRSKSLRLAITGAARFAASRGLALPKWCRNLARAIVSLNQIKQPPLEAQQFKHLTRIFESDILTLQTLIGRDLTQWLA